MVHPEDVDLAELAAETCKLVEPLAAQKALAFGCVTPDRLPATTDPGKVRQILLNLLSNAIKFTAVGEVRLVVSDAGDSIVFEVRDTGIGVSPEAQGRVFEPFHQVGTTAGSRPGGTGLGLSVSRGLARLLGGDITVASEPGVGSAFTLQVPTTYQPI